MAKDLLLITTYNRPDYLRVCLEYLQKADGIDSKDIWIFVDRGKQLIREFYEVVNDFPNLDISVHFRAEHRYHGNSYNTLNAYVMAYEFGAKYGTEYIYLVEDDVLVMPDFFRWHEAVHKMEKDIMCSVTYRCSRNAARDKKYDNDPEAYLISGQDYASIGVCWKREKLEPIVSHAKTEYFADLQGYLKKHFPQNRFNDCFTEQDGLIMRIMGETHGNTAWPFVPRCYHVGVASYNRPRGPRLSYQEIKEMIRDPEKIKQADRDFGDIEIVPNETPQWNKLYCAQRFD